MVGALLPASVIHSTERRLTRTPHDRAWPVARGGPVTPHRQSIRRL